VVWVSAGEREAGIQVAPRAVTPRCITDSLITQACCASLANMHQINWSALRQPTS